MLNLSYMGVGARQCYRGEFKGEDYFTNVSLSYNNAWGDSHLDAVVGAEYLKQVRTGLWVQAKE